MFNRKLRKQIENLKEKNLKYHAEYFKHIETISSQTRQISEMKNENLRLKEENRELKFFVTENEHLRRALEDARKSVGWYQSEYCNATYKRDEMKHKLDRCKIKWFSVTKDKPGLKDDFIGYLNGCVFVFYGSLLSEEYMAGVIKKITHWMPLNALPTTEGNFVEVYKKINLSEIGVTPSDIEPINVNTVNDEYCETSSVEVDKDAGSECEAATECEG